MRAAHAIGPLARCAMDCYTLVPNQETCEAMGVQGAAPPAGARGVPALSLFPKRLRDDALGRRQTGYGEHEDD